ncbi:hypothetical protein [Marivirga tractuosa]|uniref:hypothetical protein n=1 Tax=Marivirga tractuosa TaxID=1006 RepID=UPI00160EBD55|nr:hypothetical protein [Marivirga tractuosa]
MSGKIGWQVGKFSGFDVCKFRSLLVLTIMMNGLVVRSLGDQETVDSSQNVLIHY